MVFTREEIEAIEVGKTKIAAGLGAGTFGAPTLVTSIHAKAEDVAGKLFVCGYRQFGEGASISFSIKEGDQLDGRIYRIF